MNHDKLIEKWLTHTPSDESVDTVKAVLVRVFGEDSVCKGTGDSHQLRIKHAALKDMPGFTPFGHLSIPVSKGQRVKGIYLKRIAQAVKRIEEVKQEEKEK